MQRDPWLRAASALPHGSLRCAVLRSNISPPTATPHPARNLQQLDRIRFGGRRDPVSLVRKPPDLGVLVCEALRERSEQRANKYPEVGGWRSRAGARSYRATVAGWGSLVPGNGRELGLARTGQRSRAGACSYAVAAEAAPTALPLRCRRAVPPCASPGEGSGHATPVRRNSCPCHST